jgi:hypothetical protein
MLIALGAMIISLVSCSKQEKSADGKQDKPAEQGAQAAQKTFASPADAGAAFLAAAKAGDQDALLAIFGKDAKDVLSSGDAVKDKDMLQDFVAAYGQMNRWVKIKAGGQMLFTGQTTILFQFLWTKILLANGPSTPRPVRTKFLRAVSVPAS